MNLFKGLLFLHGHITDPSLFEDDYASQFGNRIAAERDFRDEFAEPTFARRATPSPACPSTR